MNRWTSTIEYSSALIPFPNLSSKKPNRREVRFANFSGRSPELVPEPLFKGFVQYLQAKRGSGTSSRLLPRKFANEPHFLRFGVPDPLLIVEVCARGGLRTTRGVKLLVHVRIYRGDSAGAPQNPSPK